MRGFLLALLICLAVGAETYEFRGPAGLKFACHLDLLPAKSYRPGTADYMWPSFSGPRLNLVLHKAAPEATFEEELDFAFGEKLRPTSIKSPKGYSLARGEGFVAAFVLAPKGRVFVGARTRSKPPLPAAELEKVVLGIVRSAYD